VPLDRANIPALVEANVISRLCLHRPRHRRRASCSCP